MLVQEAEADPRLGPVLDRLAARPDVTLVRLASTGLARSRNAALDARAARSCCSPTTTSATRPAPMPASAASSPRTRGSTSSSAARSTPTAGRASAPCPAGRLTRLNAARASSHEIAVRLAPVRAKGVRFDEGFGVGAGTRGDARRGVRLSRRLPRRGARGLHDPLPVSVHPHESSGFVWDGAAQARARALVFARVFGRAAAPVRLAFALKNIRRFASLADLRTFLRG